MEEKKSKVVELESGKVADAKLTYEQLNEIAMQLSQQLENAKRQLNAMNMTNVFKRLDYLFKVVELADNFDAEFVVSCTEEIKSLITVPEEPQEENNTEE